MKRAGAAPSQRYDPSFAVPTFPCPAMPDPAPSSVTRAGLGLLAPKRQRLSFRAVNRSDAPEYEPGLQRHHLLPRQLLTRPSFRPMLTALGRETLDFDDFRRNGLLLPANDQAVLTIGLPLHRGPHRDYNAMVIERVGLIEETWSARRGRGSASALQTAYEQLEQLQLQLRAQLLDQQSRLRLNRRDPLGQELDFSELDAMAATLWLGTAPLSSGSGREWGHGA